jgi:hypothetical protein
LRDHQVGCPPDKLKTAGGSLSRIPWNSSTSVTNCSAVAV